MRKAEDVGNRKKRKIGRTRADRKNRGAEEKRRRTPSRTAPRILRVSQALNAARSGRLSSYGTVDAADSGLRRGELPRAVFLCSFIPSLRPALRPAGRLADAKRRKGKSDQQQYSTRFPP